MAGPVPVRPALDGRPRALELGSDLTDGPALLDHQAGDRQTSTRGQGCVKRIGEHLSCLPAGELHHLQSAIPRCSPHLKDSDHTTSTNPPDQ